LLSSLSLLTLLLFLLLSYAPGVDIFLDDRETIWAVRLVCGDEIYEVDLAITLENFDVIKFDVLLLLRLRLTNMISVQLQSL